MATFDALSYEHVIPLPDLNTDLLLDVQLSLHGAPIPGKWGFPEDVRVSFNSTDITQGVISEPRKVLEAGNDNGRISKQYEAALEGWLLLERTLKDEYPVQSFDKETMVWRLKSLSSSSLMRAHTPSPNSVPLGATTAARPGFGARRILRMMS